MYTRCTYCDTWLHISAEQLRSGMGQVQCGSCGEVFNALAHLAEVSPAAPQLEPVSTADLPPELLASADSAVPAPQSSATADPGSILADVALKPAPRPQPEDAQQPEPETGVQSATRAPQSGPSLGELVASAGVDEDTTVEDMTIPDYSNVAADSSDDLAVEPDLALSADASSDSAAPMVPADPEDAVADPATDPTTGPGNPSFDGPIYAAEPEPQPRARDDDVDVSGISVSALDADDIPLALRADYARRQQSEEAPREGARWTLIIVSAIALLALPLQYALFQPDDLVRRYPLVRPHMEQFCATLGCRIQVREDRSLIEMVGREVRIHPQFEGALQVQAAFINRGPYAQSYPTVRFTLFNVTGDVIGARQFEPAEYLRRPNVDGLRLQPGQTTQIQLDLIAPEDAAVSFEFEFI